MQQLLPLRTRLFHLRRLDRAIGDRCKKDPVADMHERQELHQLWLEVHQLWLEAMWDVTSHKRKRLLSIQAQAGGIDPATSVTMQPRACKTDNQTPCSTRRCWDWLRALIVGGGIHELKEEELSLLRGDTKSVPC